MGIRKPREQDLVNLCMDWLRLNRCVVWRQNQGAMQLGGPGNRRFIRFCHKDGISDIIGMLPSGRFLAVECKRPGNQPTEHQAEFIREVNATGGLAVCVTNLRELATQLEHEITGGAR